MTKRRDLEGPIHRACLEYLERVMPGAIVHHSANEIPISGRNIKRAIAKAKWNGMKPGFPDLIVLYRGWTLGFEVKAEGGRMSGDQKAMQADFEAQGIPYSVVRSIEDVREALIEWGVPFVEKIELRGQIS
jgi:hypothetical protein